MTTIQILVPMVGTREQVPIYEFGTYGSVTANYGAHGPWLRSSET